MSNEKTAVAPKLKKVKFIKNPSTSTFMLGGVFEGDVAEYPEGFANELINAGIALPTE